MDWPDNEVPDSIGQPATQDDTTSAATSSTPDATQGGDTPAGAADAATPSIGEGAIPKYRFDEVNERFRTVSAQNAYLQSQLQGLLQVVQKLAPNGQPPSAEQGVEQLDEREQKIVQQLDRLLRHAPVYQQLRPLLERVDRVQEVVDREGFRTEQEQQHWKAVATRTMGNVLTEFAKVTLGADKRPEDLSPEQHRWAREAFTTWCQMDPQRIARYEALEPSLVNDFITAFRTGVGGAGVTPVTPQQRQVAANTQRRAEAVRRLPTSGTASTPVGAPPPKINPLDEDAVHASGWQFAQAALNGSR